MNIVFSSDIGGTDDYGAYVRESFQLTSGEAISGQRVVDVSLPSYDPTKPFPSIQLVVLDGDLYVLDEGAPPGVEPLAEDAGLLHARR